MDMSHDTRIWPAERPNDPCPHISGMIGGKNQLAGTVQMLTENVIVLIPEPSSDPKGKHITTRVLALLHCHSSILPWFVMDVDYRTDSS